MPNYNHYTPQSDGSYRRSTIPENNRRPNPRPPYQGQQHQPPQPQNQEPPHQPEPQKNESCQDSRPEQHHSNHQQSHAGSGEGILSFLRGLLPRQIDAADLLVISLLLLINRDECSDEDLSPLLTIALYFLL